MKSQTSQKIIKEIARNKLLKESQIEEIIRSQFRKVRLTMEEMDYEGDHYPIIQLPKFGKFMVIEKRKKKK